MGVVIKILYGTYEIPQGANSPASIRGAKVVVPDTAFM